MMEIRIATNPKADVIAHPIKIHTPGDNENTVEHIAPNNSTEMTVIPPYTPIATQRTVKVKKTLRSRNVNDRQGRVSILSSISHFQRNVGTPYNQRSSHTA
jgi:uncharacterized Zn finger protein